MHERRWYAEMSFPSVLPTLSTSVPDLKALNERDLMKLADVLQEVCEELCL